MHEAQDICTRRKITPLMPTSRAIPFVFCCVGWIVVAGTRAFAIDLVMDINRVVDVARSSVTHTLEHL